MTNFSCIDLPTFCDARGSLTVLEGVLPFAIARAYWIYGSDGKTRGGHRHRLTRQALIALCGRVEVFVTDGIAQDNVVLDTRDRCLLVEPKDWHTMTFSGDAVLLVVASHPYDRADYIEAPYE